MSIFCYHFHLICFFPTGSLRFSFFFYYFKEGAKRGKKEKQNLHGCIQMTKSDSLSNSFFFLNVFC